MNNDDTSDDLEDLKERTNTTNRIKQTESTDSYDKLEKSIVKKLHEVEKGETQKTVSFWDGDITALLRALEQYPDIQEQVGRALQSELEQDNQSTSVDRSMILRLVVRVGLQTAAPEVVEALLDAKAKSARDL